MAEHRIALRRRTFLKGRIEFNNRQNSAECVVRDLSDTGARIALIGTVMLPDHFDLHLPNRNETIACQLSWRRKDEIGVRFEQERDAGEPHEAVATDVAKKMRELEGEVARLRRLIEELKAHPDKVTTLLNNVV